MNVVLISHDHRLGAILTMALSAPEQLTVLDSPAEVSDRREAEIDAVVLDLPADSRRDAYQELRQRYEGRVVVPVDNAKDTSGWPPDAKRRFLVRPFQVADLIAGVQEPKETSVTERAAKQRRRFRWSRDQVPAFPALTAAPARTEQPQAAGEPPADATVEDSVAFEDAQVTQAEDDEAVVAEAEADEPTVEDDAEDDQAAPALALAGDEEDDEAALAPAEDEEDDEALLQELQGLVLVGAGEDERLQAGAGEPPASSAEEEPAVDAAPPAPPAPPLPVQASVAMAKAVALQQWLEAEEARRLRRRQRLVVANLAGGLVLLLAGVGIGRALAPEPPQQVTTPPQPPQQKVQLHSAPTPPACSEAMDNADQVISYLVAKIRDDRLSRSIQAYGANARACRSTGR